MTADLSNETLARLAADRERALKEWTADRIKWHHDRRQLRAQIRDLERVLSRYLIGEAKALPQKNGAL